MPDLEARVAALESGRSAPTTADSVSIACFSGDWDRLFAACVIANGAAAMGQTVQGHVDVEDSQMVFEVQLPMMLGFVEPMIAKLVVRIEGAEQSVKVWVDGTEVPATTDLDVEHE